MSQPAHRFLQEFAIDEDNPNASIVLPIRPRSHGDTPAISSPDVSQIEDAYARGYAEGQSATQSKLEAQIAELTASCEARISEVERTFSRDVSEMLGRESRQQLARIHALLEEQVLNVLVPVLRRTLSELSIREIAAGMRTLANDGSAVVIELSGPQEIVERVWQSYQELEPGNASDAEPVVRFTPGDALEVECRVNGTLIQSRLGEWINKIDEAIG